MTSENNKRIAKNTLLLYFRMIITLAVSLFTVRVVLKTLGVVDYGIYNVVGGIVVMFSFLSNTMASASERFFAFELGRNNYEQLKKTFSITITIYTIIALVVFILAETIGLWFLNNQMVVPFERISAANWIYQFSIFSFIITILTIPYNAVIIAHENMKIFAYMSIVEVLLKLIIVYILCFFSFDKMKLYAILVFIVTCVITYVYRVICKRKYIESIFKFYWDIKLFKNLLNYSGWNLFGATAGIINDQGINILLNIFFGPVVNASRAIAYQINSAVNQFVTNFFTAVRPQITKYYAAGEKEQMMSLVIQSSKLSFFLIFILSMPVLLETNYILRLWLKELPEYSVLFTKLVIVAALIDSLSFSLTTAALSTGDIKRYQIVVGGMLLVSLPTSYLFLKLGFPPQVTMFVAIIISIICLFLRLWMLKRLINLSLIDYSQKVLKIVLIVSVLAYIFPVYLSINLAESFSKLMLIGISGLITSASSIYFFGLSKIERVIIFSVIKNRIIKR